MSTQIIEWLERAGATKVKASGDNNISSTCPFCDPMGQWNNCFATNTETGLYTCYRPVCSTTGHVRQLLQELLGYSRDQADQATEGLEVWKQVEEEELPDYEDRFSSKKAQTNTLYEASIGLYKFTPSYMVRRGFTVETLKRFEIGYDMDRKRVTFPVRDVSGELLGYSTRATQDHDFPKYLHLGFKKSSVLYGESYRNSTKVTLTVGEGNADALALGQLLPSTYLPVATLGSLVSKAQMSRMFQYSKVLLCFDQDEAGDVATKRVGDQLEAWGHREVSCLSFLNFLRVKDPAEILKVQQFTQRRAIPVVQSYQRWLERHLSRKEDSC